MNLDLEEIVEPKILRSGRTQRVTRKTLNEFHEYTHNTLKTSFCFSLSPDFPQQFSTDLGVCLSFNLIFKIFHFVFYLSLLKLTLTHSLTHFFCVID
jgi:hypothetical protein